MLHGSSPHHGAGRKLAWYMLRVANGVTSLRNTFHPHLREYGPKLASAVSQTRNWIRSPVRCMARHLHTNSSLAPVLKCKKQRTVACMAWRPLSASEPAVGPQLCDDTSLHQLHHCAGPGPPFTCHQCGMEQHTNLMTVMDGGVNISLPGCSAVSLRCS